MIIAVAQTRPVAGDIAANLTHHLRYIHVAMAQEVDVLVFPELSLTGYEPPMAAQLASDGADSRFAELQHCSDAAQMAIAVGLPLRTNDKPQIGMLIFRPQQAVLTYGKHYLHASEQAYFSAGAPPAIFPHGDWRIAPAICYELSCAAHAQSAAAQGATLYMASICCSQTGIGKDVQALAGIAKQYGIMAMMANYVGTSGDYACAGQSGFWDENGACIAQLDGEEEALLVYDRRAQAFRRISI